MEIAERIKRYRAIEEYRKRPLIVYATSTRIGLTAMMAGDAVREFVDQIDAVNGNSSVDVLIHSTGGDGLTAWKLMSELRERFDNVAVLVPLMAFSAATIFALGADEIVMHPHASLGPIDPQITIRLPDGSQREFAFEDVGAFLRFLKQEIALTEQDPVSKIVDRLFSVVDPLNVGAAKRASELSTDVGERLLQMHMRGEGEKDRPREIAERLNKQFFAHGDAVSRTRAIDLQLKVASSDPQLERLMWDAYLGLEDYLQLRSPFKPVKYFLENGGAAELAPKGPLKLPTNTNPAIAQQVWNQALQNALDELTRPAVEVNFSAPFALIESPRIASETRADMILTGARVAGGEITISAVDTSAGWTNVPIPNPTNAPGGVA